MIELVVHAYIYKTREYGAFTLYDKNRGGKGVNKSHLSNLTKSMLHKNLLPHQPITVDENLNIIDGNSRFMAAKNAGIELYFTIDNTVTVRDGIVSSKVRKNWSFDEMITTYALEGNKEYQKLKGFVEETGACTDEVLTLVESLSDQPKGSIRASIPQESFVFLPEFEKARPFLEKVAEIREILRDRGVVNARLIGRSFYRGALIVVRTKGYNHEELLRKLPSYRYDVDFGSYITVARSLQTAYNTGKSKRKMHLRF